MSTRSQGQKSEIVAAFYLQACGYHIVETNWRYSHYELDIVAYDPESKELTFVEVKSAKSLESAYRHLTSNKVNYLSRAIENYLNQYQYDTIDCQLDLIFMSHTANQELITLDHLTDVL